MWRAESRIEIVFAAPSRVPRSTHGPLLPPLATPNKLARVARSLTRGRRQCWVTPSPQPSSRPTAATPGAGPVLKAVTLSAVLPEQGRALPGIGLTTAAGTRALWEGLPLLSRMSAGAGEDESRSVRVLRLAWQRDVAELQRQLVRRKRRSASLPRPTQRRAEGGFRAGGRGHQRVPSRVAALAGPGGALEEGAGANPRRGRESAGTGAHSARARRTRRECGPVVAAVTVRGGWRGNDALGRARRHRSLTNSCTTSGAAWRRQKSACVSPVPHFPLFYDHTCRLRAARAGRAGGPGQPRERVEPLARRAVAGLQAARGRGPGRAPHLPGLPPPGPGAAATACLATPAPALSLTTRCLPPPDVQLQAAQDALSREQEARAEEAREHKRERQRGGQDTAALLDEAVEGVRRPLLQDLARCAAGRGWAAGTQGCWHRRSPTATRCCAGRAREEISVAQREANAVRDVAP